MRPVDKASSCCWWKPCHPESRWCWDHHDSQMRLIAEDTERWRLQQSLAIPQNDPGDEDKPCTCRHLGTLSLRSGDICSACEERIKR